MAVPAGHRTRLIVTDYDAETGRLLRLRRSAPRPGRWAPKITAYDAAYVALAERLDSRLITCDSRLTAAGGPRCSFDLVA